MSYLLLNGRFIFAILVSLILLAPASRGVKAQPIIINEVYNSSSTDEWVELLVVQDNLDIRGYDLRDFTSGGSPNSPLTFTSNALWSSLKKGTMIVVGTATTTFTEDTDPSDYLLMIKANNATYFTATGVFLFAGSSDAIQIRDASAINVFGVSWGAANASSTGSPQVHFTGASTSNTSMAFQGNDVSQLTSTANWIQNTAATQAAGNSTTNTAWIASLRAHADGSGTATVSPDTTKHGLVYSIAINYHRDTSFTVTDMRIKLPPNFAWSHSTGDVSATNITATTSVSGDTIYFHGITFNVDTTVITIQNVTAPDSTAFCPIPVETKAVTDYAPTIPTDRIVNFGLPVTVGQVKGNDANGVALRAGNLVTISGIVTVANQFGGPSYIQDNTGGIAIFGPILTASVQTGDEIIVTGKIDPFNGLTELTSPTLDSIVSHSNPVTPVVVTVPQVKNDGAGGLESYEGLLVRFNGVLVKDNSGNPIASWAVSGSGTNYHLTDGTDTVDVRVDNSVDFANAPAPQSTFDLIGVVSQFKSTSPFIGGYQVMPRQATDILALGPVITTLPYESNLTSSSMRINWTTANPGTSRLRYGTTKAYEFGTIEPDTVHRTVHAIDITGLSPASIYHVQAFSTGSDTSTSGDLVVSTSSLGSSDVINVYFNKSVDTSVAFGEKALGNQDLVSLIVNRIDHVHHSIDLALYSLSAVNQGGVIASHLITAHNNGISVRVICEHDNVGTGGSYFPTLQGAGIPLIDDTYDPVWNGQGLMHNKFFVIDGRGGAPESVWVWAGSWNPTSSGTNSDRQNSIEIQDQALAGAYEAEFNLMWGSNTDTPNQTNSRFGGRKTDIAPHNFVIGGIPVSVYFSPSDQTTTHIKATMAKAQHSVAGCILTFTRKDIADTIIARKNLGKKARVVVDNNTDTGNQYAYLLSNGVDIHLKGGSGLLHHKYAVIDGDDITGTQYLETGSHNWSNSAETSNDENSLILKDRRIANLYLQEFTARYYEAGGTDSIHVTSSPLFSAAPASLSFGTVSTGSSKEDSITVSNPGNLTLSVSSVTSTDAVFTVTPSSATIAPAASQTFHVTFSPLIAGAKNASLVIVHNAPGSPDTVALSGTGTGAPAQVTTGASLRAGWNLVSLPSLVSNGRKDSVFPGSKSRLFGYASGYFVPPGETLASGRGYWLKFDTARVDSIKGFPAMMDSIPVAAGWNLIGSISSPVAPASIVQTPSNNIASPYFGFDSSYTIADSIRPAKGYWIKVKQSGSLKLSSSGAVPKVRAAGAPESFNRLAISDAMGMRQTLYFGANTTPATDPGMFALPPLPPPEGFDARFASGGLLEIYPAASVKPLRLQISVQTGHFPLTAEWTISAGETRTISLGPERGAEPALLQLTKWGKAVIPGESSGLLLNVSPPRLVPEKFSLGQNYPNPFNPTTAIPFGVPRQSRVTLRIFNVLGQAVATLLDDAEYPAGFFDATFDASRLSSGVYYYELTAGERDGGKFRQVRKLLLLR